MARRKSFFTHHFINLWNSLGQVEATTLERGLSLTKMMVVCYLQRQCASEYRLQGCSSKEGCAFGSCSRTSQRHLAWGGGVGKGEMTSGMIQYRSFATFSLLCITATLNGPLLPSLLHE